MKLLKTIQSDQLHAKEPVRGAASDEQIATVQKAVIESLGAILPGEYEEFLRLSDGLDYNGLVLYGSTASPEQPDASGFWQGLVAANQLWRESPENSSLLILGDSDMDLFTVDLNGGNPARRDRVTGETVETYPSISSMLEAALSEHL